MDNHEPKLPAGFDQGPQVHYQINRGPDSIMGRFSQEELDPIWEEVNQIASDWDSYESHNDKLAGHIKREYSLVKSKSYIQDLMEVFCQAYAKEFKYLLNNFNLFTDMTNPPKIVLDSAWVNYMGSNEFNPIHNHSGLFSFVIWLQIPYTLADEKTFFPDVNGDCRNGCFEFHFVDTDGQIKNTIVPADNELEGHFLVFSSRQMHSVNPFYSTDKHRISISGNFKFKND
jgi:hypothetical protein